MNRTRILTVSGALASSLLLSACVTIVLPSSTPAPTSSAPATSAAPSTSAPDSPSPTPSVTTSEATPTPTPTPTDGSLPAFGPKGLGELRLGMTKAQASATGLAESIRGSRGTCGGPSDGRLLGSDPEADLAGKLFFSANTGKLVIIAALDGYSTPEGIHLGSTTAEVKQAYPTWDGDRKRNYGVGYVQAASGTYYRIYVYSDYVMELTLQAIDQDCAE